MATFVLVHGSFAGGWCWRKVSPLLREAGHEVCAPTLTGLGERRHLLTRGTDLALHIRDIVNVLEFETLQDVILVGHSYGGMVITGVAEAIPERLQRLVYIDAFTPRDGQSAFDLRPDIRDRWSGRIQDGWLIPANDPARFGVTDEADLAWMRALQVRMPLLTHSQPLSAPEHRAQHLPRSYLLFTPGGDFEAMARETGATHWDFHTVDAGHDGIITHPDAVVAVLRRCAESDTD
jgi:pimeloyl-ACP methyl ester carboxylesterase